MRLGSQWISCVGVVGSYDGYADACGLIGSGADVSASLWERRFEIAHLIADDVRREVEDIAVMLKGRGEDGYGDLPQMAPRLLDYIQKLDKYLRLLYPKSFGEEQEVRMYSELSELLLWEGRMFLA